jgi:hypothetical protein
MYTVLVCINSIYVMYMQYIYNVFTFPCEYSHVFLKSIPQVTFGRGRSISSGRPLGLRATGGGGQPVGSSPRCWVFMVFHLEKMLGLGDFTMKKTYETLTFFGITPD